MLSDRDDTDPAHLLAAIAARGDRAAFASLFGFYAPRIKGFLMRTGSAAEIAEEIAQEAMLSVWRKAAHLRRLARQRLHLDLRHRPQSADRSAAS